MAILTSRGISGGVGNFGVMDECIITEEMAFGCTGINTALDSTNLGVSLVWTVSLKLPEVPSTLL